MFYYLKIYLYFFSINYKRVSNLFFCLHFFLFMLENNSLFFKGLNNNNFNNKDFFNFFFDLILFRCFVHSLYA